ELQALGVKLFKGDVTDKESMREAMTGCPRNDEKAMLALVKPFDALLPDSYTSEGLRVIAGTTDLGDNSKAKRELGFNSRPVNEGWAETVKHEHEMAMLKK
ncbi:MAG: hypothetical protein HXY38_13745, partial [Chloroflexi bacterium]|nr:hypothetical protein [Chloroflexota bacterium]